LVTHLLPSGVLHPGKKCVLGAGMVVEPRVLLEEIEGCKQRGLLADDNDLLLSDRAHIILRYHRDVDALRESRAGAIGTTKRGIGPAYEAKMARRGVRVADLLREDRVRPLLEQNLAEVNPYVERLGGKPYELDALVTEALELGQKLSRYVADTSRFVYDAIRRGESVLCEGAQGALLDVDHGTYPFVTSSSPAAGGALAGAGVGPGWVDRVMGIAKAYVTRVGAGPFPTEATDEEAEVLRAAGDEFGTTTGRPRRCGWLDTVGLRYAARVNGLTELFVTKLDVLSRLERIPVAVAYRIDGEVTEDWPMTQTEVHHAEPVYELFEGWREDISGVTRLEDLPRAARTYVDAIEKLGGVPVTAVGVGPGREQTVVQPAGSASAGAPPARATTISGEG
ncbi:MAG: adenylosuccinate synthase, partial [Actinomycetes bacterium]